MRTIPPAALAKLQQTSGVEPVIVVRVWWGKTTYTDYCDKKFQSEGLLGSLLEISPIEDVVDLNQSSSSVSLTVMLDDADGAIKAIYNYNDIHKTRVQVLQWFSDLALAEAFVLFEGNISSPIVWAEGTRTLKFDVVTQLEDLEVGFAAEEGQFRFIPSSSVGQMWPIVFGTVAGVRAIQLTESPTAITAFGFAIVDDEIWQAEIDDLAIRAGEATSLRDQCMILFLQYFMAAGLIGLQDIFGDDPNIQSQKQQYLDQANQYLHQAYEYQIEAQNISAEIEFKNAEWELQKSFEYRTIGITQTNLPTGLVFTAEIGNYTAIATVVGNAIALQNLTEIPDINEKVGTNEYVFDTASNQYKREFKGQKFVWIDGGTEVKIHNFPRYYIVAFGAVVILNVWATNKNGRAVVPRNWYQIVVTNYGSGLIATRLIFPTPLTSFPGGWSDGDIEVDIRSGISTNAVDIMLWTIARFSNLGHDAASFNHVRTRLANYPCNFALTQRMNLVDFLQDVAFQSRCAIWLNDRKFFLRYLPERLTAIDTLTDTDIEVNTVTLNTTDTEKVVTKFTALWKSRHNQSEPNKIIYRNNIKKYGLHEESYEFYIYNHYKLVAKSAEFWMIRKSNIFKLLTCNVMLHKLKIEAFDPVEVTFSEMIAATTAVTGVVQKSTYDPNNDAISLEIWLPVRLGEMTVFDFAEPMNIQRIYPPRGDDNINTGNPYEDAHGELAPQETFTANQQIQFAKPQPYTHGRGEPIGDAQDEPPGEFIVRLDPAEINAARPAGVEQFNNILKRTINPIVHPAFDTVSSGAFYGEVLERLEDGTYTCNVWLFGFDGNSSIITVKIGKLRAESVLPTGYPLVVNRTALRDSQQNVVLEYWAQPPIWVPLQV